MCIYYLCLLVLVFRNCNNSFNRNCNRSLVTAICVCCWWCSCFCVCLTGLYLWWDLPRWVCTQTKKRPKVVAFGLGEWCVGDERERERERERKRMRQKREKEKKRERENRCVCVCVCVSVYRYWSGLERTRRLLWWPSSSWLLVLYVWWHEWVHACVSGWVGVGG